MKILGVIPARFGSSRLEGKPLMDICGKPMVWWVYQQATKVSILSEVIVATDDERIINVCDSFSIPSVLTSRECENGTERVAEVARKIEADMYITIQGDEPLIEPQTIEELLNLMITEPEVQCATLKTKFINPVDVVNATTPKVVTDNKDNIVLISRSPIPYPKAALEFDYFKPLGVYAFRPNAIAKYTSLEKGLLEKAEEIELLRFIENGIPIRIGEVVSSSIAVDTIKDLQRVRKIITNISK